MSHPLFRLTLTVLSDGEFGLDGGAMFGMVPRERWIGWCPPDERNRVRLATHTLLVRGPDFVLLVDPGIGDTVDRDAFAVTKEPTLEASLKAEGLGPGDVTHVTYTHLHFDHAGGGDRFPNAIYLVAAREWEAFRHPSVLHNRSYRREDRPPADRMRLVEGENEPLPGVRFRPTGGHTPGHQVVIFEDRAIFWGDLFPTRHHLSPPRIMAYDLDPLRVIDQKTELLAESASKRWLNFLYHDLDPAPFRIGEAGGRFSIA
jgi:glyoxylase-like metal-dependent hydrolase (beta-lactamase superfamily II)